MLTTHGRKQPREEPDKAWLWIVVSLTLVILAICAVLYSHARNCGPLSPAAPPEIGLLVCSDPSS
jgi:hypothetical protein